MKLDNIAIIRALCIFLIVIFHTYEYMYAGHFPDTATAYYNTYFWFNQCIVVNIAMPMFTVISGFLFAHLYDKGKYRVFGDFIKKKSLRLLLPFFVFGILMMLTIGVPFKPWKLLSGSFSHLWYLPALFWCFVLGWLFKKFINSIYIQIICLILFFVLHTQGHILPHIMGIHNLTIWFSWFMLGEILATYNEQIERVINKYHLKIFLLIPFCVQILLYPVYYGSPTWYSTVTLIPVIVFLLYFNWNDMNFFSKSLILFSQYSFGVFIFHNWLGPFLISSTAKKTFPLTKWATDYILLFPACLTIVIFFISFLLAWCVMKTKIGKMLIG